MTIQRAYHVGINVTDMDRSVAFYESLGFVVESRGFTSEDPQLSRMFGLDAKKMAYAFMALANDANSLRLDMVQFIDPPGKDRPPAQIHETGLTRICFHADDLEAMHKDLVDRGVPFYRSSEICSMDIGPTVLKFFMFVDPDGVIIEISNIGQIIEVANIAQD